jgi:phosphoglycolate phosphatase/pyrophosphatase PpaX
MRYKCLILDHDDTVVKSTPEIHYPSFVEALKVLRPNMKPFCLEDFISYCFNPGFSELCKDILKFSKEEQAYQYEVWKSYTKSRVPDFYPGFKDLIVEFKQKGGIIAVVSHSESLQIVRDYMLNCKLEPDIIFGWELEEYQRKPNPYPIKETIKKFNLQNSDAIVVDDLKPGLDMARSCNIAFAGAGWSQGVPEIREYMEHNSDYYFTTVDDLKRFIFSE